MAAYLIVDLKVFDEPLMAEYRKQVGASIESFGGKVLVRAGGFDVMEGDWHPTSLVLIEFPSRARVHEWYASPGYKELIAMRQKAARTDAVVVDSL